jgi:hypothetical protein
VSFSRLVAVFAVQVSTLQAVKLSVIESRAETCILGPGTDTAGVRSGVACLKCITKPPIFAKNECTVLHGTRSLFARAPSFLVVDRALFNPATAFSKGNSGASNVNAINWICVVISSSCYPRSEVQARLGVIPTRYRGLQLQDKTREYQGF